MVAPWLHPSKPKGATSQALQPQDLQTMVAPLNEKTIIKSNNIRTHTHTHIRTYTLYYSVMFENYAKRVQRVQPILSILTLTKNTAVAPFGCTLGKFD